MTLKERETRDKNLWLKALGKQIRTERLKRKLSGSDLSPILEQANLFRIERGEVNPSVYLVKQICEFMGLELEELYRKVKEQD